MKPSPADTDATLSGPGNFSEPKTAFRFDEARAHVRNAVRCAEADGISSETLALALIGEALPPIVHEHGASLGGRGSDETRPPSARRALDLECPMGEVVRFVPKSELERARLIREARAIYESIFPEVEGSRQPKRG